jgi:hypothetical protein
MTLASFAITCGADPKWVQNTARILGLRLCYTEEEARRLGLVKRLQEELQLPLSVADRLARGALEAGGAGEATVGEGPTARVTVDVPRYLSDFAVRLARSLAHHEPRRRGRRHAGSGDVVTRARRHGWDIGLLRSSLAATPADRIRRLDENMEFVRALRARRG